MIQTSLGAVDQIRRFGKDTPTHERATTVLAASWPHYGRVEIRDVTCSWQEDGEPVLNNISLTVEPGQHIGICGRTSSGKSSLILALS